MSTSSAVFGGLDHITPSSSEQLCYVHCNFCDTVLAVSVPCSSLFKIVTVRCGHCTNLLSVNMRALLLPPSNSLHLAQTFLAPTTHNSLLEEMSCPQPPPPPPPPPLLVDQITSNTKDSTLVTPVKRVDQTPVNRPPEKRQRVPSAYNRFIKDEIQRIKAGNPDITHREAFSAAAKNWAHFPHIQFGLMPEGQKKKGVHQQMSMHHIQGGDHDLMLKDGFYAPAPGSTAAANVGVSPF